MFWKRGGEKGHTISAISKGCSTCGSKYEAYWMWGCKNLSYIFWSVYLSLRGCMKFAQAARGSHEAGLTQPRREICNAQYLLYQNKLASHWDRNRSGTLAWQYQAGMFPHVRKWRQLQMMGSVSAACWLCTEIRGLCLSWKETEIALSSL